MKSKKNSITIVLITSSITLLLVLQVFWLKSTYQEEHQRIEKEARNLFRNLILTMSDSLMQKNIHVLPSRHTRQDFMIQVNDSLQVFSRKPYPPPNIDSIKSGSNVQVFVYSQSGKDSINDYLKPLAGKIRTSKGKSFSIRLNGESLAKKDLEKSFADALTKAELPVSFEIEAVRREFGFPLKSPKPNEDTIYSPVGGFKANLSDIKWFVLKRISPQVFFSVFLTALTSISFWFLFRSIRAQQRLAELKNDFISNMTHELKTPVTTVGVAIEALKNFNGLENKELTKEYLTIAQNELNRLSLLTDKILKTAIFENKGIDFQPETVNLEKIIEQTLSSMKLVFDKHHASISFEKIGSDFQLQGSQVHLTNVVYNLLDNALKYSNENSIIKILLIGTGKEIILSVEDNGIGILPEYKKKVFEKFFRVPTGNVHNSKGYGLGLSYVDSVVKEHGGTIKVESEVKKGSKFIVHLPIQNLKFKN